MMEVTSSKPPENDVISLSFSELLTEADVENEFFIKEEMIEEVMQELYKEITSPVASTCREAATSASSLSVSLSSGSQLSSTSLSAPLFFESGKTSESCGASMSDSASSVMAGVEYADLGGLGKMNVEVELSDDMAWVEEEEEEEEEREEKIMMDQMKGCDGVDFGDEWLEKVMAWTPLHCEGWSGT